MSKGVTRRRQSRQALNFSSLLISAKRDRWKGIVGEEAGPFPFPWPGSDSKPLDRSSSLAQRCITPCSPPALACKEHSWHLESGIFS